MAQLLLAERTKAPAAEPGTEPATEPATELEIGSNWVRRFINRHESLKLKYSRKYDYERAKCEDPEALNAWFRLVQNTVAKYGILTEDIQF
jgi:hypothetical protein